MNAPLLYEAQRGRISIAMVGDAMLSRALKPYGEPDYLALAKLLGSADVTFANLESTVREPHEGVPNFTQGTPMTTPDLPTTHLRYLVGMNLNRGDCARRMSGFLHLECLKGLVSKIRVDG